MKSYRYNFDIFSKRSICLFSQLPLPSGGVGKTTLTTNLGGFLADFGNRVLLINADVHSSLTRYYQVAWKAPNGLAVGHISGLLS